MYFFMSQGDHEVWCFNMIRQFVHFGRMHSHCGSIQLLLVSSEFGYELEIQDATNQQAYRPATIANKTQYSRRLCVFNKVRNPRMYTAPWRTHVILPRGGVSGAVLFRLYGCSLCLATVAEIPH